jgi:hypothetical protein
MRICKMDRADQVWGKGGPVNMGALAGVGALGLSNASAQPSVAVVNTSAASYSSEAGFTALGAESDVMSTYDSPAVVALPTTASTAVDSASHASFTAFDAESSACQHMALLGLLHLPLFHLRLLRFRLTPSMQQQPSLIPGRLVCMTATTRNLRQAYYKISVSAPQVPVLAKLLRVETSLVL